MKKILIGLSLFICFNSFGQIPVAPVGPVPTSYYHDTSDGSTWINQNTAPYSFGWLKLGSGGGTTTNPLSLTYGFTGQPLSFDGSAAITGKIDTSLLQTVLNFFPKGDTRWLRPTGNGSGLTGILWSQIGSVPTTLSGYGITDAYTKTVSDGKYVNITTPQLTSSSTLNYVWTATGTTGFGSWQAAAAGFANPMTTTGDIIYSSSGSTPARLGIGGANTLLHGGTIPSYSAIVNGDITNGTIAFSKLIGTDITGVGTLSFGSIPYSLITGTPATPTLQSVATAGNSYTGQIQAQTFYVSGTGGNAYLDLPVSSTSPASTTNRLKIYADSLDRLSWKNSLYRRTIQVPYPSDYTVRMPYLVTGTTLEDSTYSRSTYVPLTRTVNAKALSANITLGLASSDFVNQGTTTTVYHGNASGNPSFSQIAIADLSATGTPSSTTYLRGDNTWATVSSSGLSTSNFVFNEIPSGPVNGSNTAFTLANAPTSGTVEIYRNGLLQVSGTDYTQSGTSVTYLYAPLTGDNLKANYLK